LTALQLSENKGPVVAAAGVEPAIDAGTVEENAKNGGSMGGEKPSAPLPPPSAVAAWEAYEVARDEADIAYRAYVDAVFVRAKASTAWKKACKADIEGEPTP
jgi:hypothetical protein